MARTSIKNIFILCMALPIEMQLASFNECSKMHVPIFERYFYSNSNSSNRYLSSVVAILIYMYIFPHLQERKSLDSNFSENHTRPPFLAIDIDFFHFL